jgi:hypothetical protein
VVHVLLVLETTSGCVLATDALLERDEAMRGDVLTAPLGVLKVGCFLFSGVICLSGGLWPVVGVSGPYRVC